MASRGTIQGWVLEKKANTQRQEAPEEDQEAESEEEHRVAGEDGVQLAGGVEEEFPVATVKCREPEVLDDHVQQEPRHDVTPQERHVEARGSCRATGDSIIREGQRTR